MSTDARRLVVRAADATFRPYDRYGEPIAGMSWVDLSVDPESGCGSFLLRMEPGARSLPHEHVEHEDFYVIDGELVDNDGTVFRSGDFVSFRPGSRHWSTTQRGCTLAVFLRSANRRLGAGEAVD